MPNDRGLDRHSDRRLSVQQCKELSPRDSIPAVRRMFFRLLDGASPDDVSEFIAFTLAVAQVEPDTPGALATLQLMLEWDRQQLYGYFAEFQSYQDPGGLEVALACADYLSTSDEYSETDSDDFSASLGITWEPNASEEPWRESL